MYCSYSNIDISFEQQFNEYWQQFHHGQTMIQHIFQDEKNNRAAVFNIWIRLLHHEQIFVLKPEKLVLHAFADLLMNRINFYLRDKINLYLNRHQRNPYIIFLYAYALVAEVIKQLDCFCKEKLHSELSQLILYPYYYLSDNDLTEDAELYYYLKVLIADFLHDYLTYEKAKDMHSHIVIFMNEFIRANALS